MALDHGECVAVDAVGVDGVHRHGGKVAVEVGGARDDEALARELALGYRAVADVSAAVAAIHEAGVLAADRFDFVGDVLS